MVLRILGLTNLPDFARSNASQPLHETEAASNATELPDIVRSNASQSLHQTEAASNATDLSDIVSTVLQVEDRNSDG